MSNVRNPDDPATVEDVRRLLGEGGEQVIDEIVSLQPTVADLEKAAQWVAGERDLDREDGQVLKGISGEIVMLLAANDENETPTS
jgi:hypothetical protein